MRRAVEAVADAWGAVQRYVAALLLIAMTALYGFNVLIRFFLPDLASSLAWIEEAARYMMVWVVFLAAGIALEVGRHILIDIYWGRIGSRAKPWLFAAIDVVGLLFSIWMAVLAVRLTIFIFNTGQISPTLGIPAAVLYIAPVVGFTSLAFNYLLRLFSMRDARRKPVTPDWLQGGGL